jgi:hypothetical protein
LRNNKYILYEQLNQFIIKTIWYFKEHMNQFDEVVKSINFISDYTNLIFTKLFAKPYGIINPVAGCMPHVRQSNDNKVLIFN